MNDIQNNDNYSNIITLSSSALATPLAWRSDRVRRTCTPVMGHLHTCILQNTKSLNLLVGSCVHTHTTRVGEPDTI